MVVLNNICKSFNNKLCLNNINIELTDGQIVGLLGLNGSGKTTLLRIMSGVYYPNSGTIEYEEFDLNKNKDLFFVSGDLKFQESTPNKIALNYKMFYNKFNIEEFENYLNIFKLEKNDKIINYSKGMNRKLALCLALASNSKYLLIDEAFDGVDNISKKEFNELFLNYIEKNNAIIIISSHSIENLENVIDRLLVLSNNELVLNSSFNDVFDNYIKYQLAFDYDVDESKFKNLNPLSIKVNGRFIDLVFKINDEIINELNDLNPVLVNKCNLTFDELFSILMKGEE